MLENDEIFFKAKSDAIRLLSLKPRSTDELRKKLIDKSYGGDVVDQVIDLMKKVGLLDDEKFAKLIVSSAIYSSPIGKMKIEENLRKKGLNKAEIKNALNHAADYNESKAAKQLVDRRFAKVTGLSKEKIKARIFGFLKRRGFSSEAIFDAMNAYFKDFKDNLNYENK